MKKITRAFAVFLSAVTALFDLRAPCSAAVLTGDVNCDRMITVADAVLLCRFVGQEQISYPTLTEEAADCDADGLITVMDVACLLDMVLNQMPPERKYDINEICTNPDAFNYYADILAEDLRTAPDGGQYLSVPTPYGRSSGVNEAKYILALLNNGAISADVLATCLCDISANFTSYSSFVVSFSSYQDASGRTYNFSAYTCDSCRYVGDYINNIEINYVNGTYPAFFTDQITNNNINPQLYNNTAVRYFFLAYDAKYWMIQNDDFGFGISSYPYDLYSIVNG